MADEQNVTNQAITEQGGAQSAGGDPTTSTPAGDGKAPAPQEDEKKFSQKELDEHINRRLERERKNQPTKEELAAFRAWQDEQKTAEEKRADELKAAQDKQIAAEQRASDLEAKFTAMSKGVSASAVEDVIALAKGRVSEDITLDKAIDEVLKKYPQFAAGTAADTTPKGFKVGSGAADEKPPAADDKLRRAFGL